MKNQNRLLIAIAATLAISTGASFAAEENAQEPTPGPAQKVGNAVERGAEATGRGVKRAVNATARGIKRGAKAAARGIGHGAEATGRAISRTAKKVGGSGSTEQKTEN
ncbi:hypothetical protein [Propionivibrio soli]|uniref:hypothetical protein n=1 Tax=Propionivibrio soli TaxID=2976531 RepID=UPI0021E80F6C|nr:hypothetical protein [Propionivibrio soli]